MSKATTIHDIAKRLSINSSTVSRALNNDDRVAAKTKARVQAMAEQMNYQPNQLAANLRKQRSNTIGVVVPYLSRHFFSTVIAGIEEQAHQHGFNVIICQSKEESEREIKNLETMLHSRVDGILISPTLAGDNLAFLSSMMDRKIPVYFFDRHFDEMDTTRVLMNDQAIAEEMCDHLLQQSSGSMRVLTGPIQASIYRARIQGILNSFRKHGLNTEEKLHIEEVPLTLDKSQELVKQWIQRQESFDMLFCMNDMAALGGLQALLDAGYQVPKDCMVVGFSNEPVSKLMHPAITTVHQPAVAMGKVVTKKLIQHIEEPESITYSETTILKSKLIIRASSLRNE